MEDFTITPRDQRGYVHKRCGGGTVISGFDFVRLANPHAICGGATICVTCGAPVPLSDVAWEETGEPISKYRSRLRSRARWVIVLWPLCILLGAAIGYFVGEANKDPKRPRKPVDFAVVGVIAGAAACLVVVPVAYRFAVGHDPRCID